MKDNEKEADSTLERSAQLPEEILNAQKSRSDFLKWKLLLVAVLGAAGLGLQEKITPAPLLLALIPFACLYVDLVCSNLSLRQIVIGTFYVNSRRDAYECFVAQNRSTFIMEDWALYRSTYVLCLFVSVYAIFLLFLSPKLRHSDHNGKDLPAAAQEKQKAAEGAEPPSKGFTQPLCLECVIIIGAAIIGAWLTKRTQGTSERCKKLSTRMVDAEDNREKIRELLRPYYTAEGLKKVQRFVADKGCFIFPRLSNGLFPAAGFAKPGDISGYQYVWIRDNIHVAHAHYVCGDIATATRTVSTLMNYFRTHERRFHDIIKTPAHKSDPMKRPHIRFDGEKLAEISQDWAHAQNDALGYFLWLYCKLARKNLVACGSPELECLALFPVFFEAIKYWQDEDSGHWEEQTKVSASSIGTALAGLREFESLMCERNLWVHPSLAKLNLKAPAVRDLITKGEAALGQILPCESIEPPADYRRYDGALLFLIYPLEVLEPSPADIILKDIKTHLEGDYGIRRYLGDSYWSPDYKEHLSKELRTTNVSKNSKERDAHAQIGKEAQWCIFDPIISVIYGQRYLVAKKKHGKQNALELLQMQTEYLNRALRQLTDGDNGVPAFAAAEAYYLENGSYVPNDHTPLLWSQANLWLAIHQMEKSLEP